MKILVESMTKIKFRDYTMRVWREDGFRVVEGKKEKEKIDLAEDRRDLRALIYKEAAEYPGGLGDPEVEKLTRAVLALDRVNAVEALDADGNGTVLYRDWP